MKDYITKLIKSTLANYPWIIWIALTTTLAFFILHNAQWLIGDDAIIIKKTGSGLAFSIFDTINPEGGRFYPLAYYAYNILLLFNLNPITAHHHYLLVSLAFLLFSFFVFKTNRKIINETNKSKHILNLIALLFSFMIIQRAYTTFSYVFTTAWIDYLLIPIFIYFTYLFFKTQKTVYATTALLSIIYCVFCIEVIFIIPLSLGTALLLLGYKTMTKKEKTYSYSLIAIALIFLSLYYFLVYQHTTSAYDGSHGSTDNHIQNAFKMLLNQKLLIVAIGVFLYRVYLVLIKKKEIIIIFDSLLLTGLAFTFGCFILKLNWGMYYMISVIIVSFPTLYYIVKYINIKYALLLTSVISLFYVRNFPENITTVQEHRLSTTELIDMLKTHREKDYNFVWRDEVLIDNNWDKILSDWKEESLKTLLKHEFTEISFEFQSESKSELDLLFFPVEYENVTKLNKDSLDIINNDGNIIIATYKK